MQQLGIVGLVRQVRIQKGELAPALRQGQGHRDTKYPTKSNIEEDAKPRPQPNGFTPSTPVLTQCMHLHEGTCAWVATD